MIIKIKENLLALNKIGYKMRPAKLWYLRLPIVFQVRPWKMLLNTKVAEVAFAQHTKRSHAELHQLQIEIDILFLPCERIGDA